MLIEPAILMLYNSMRQSPAALAGGGSANLSINLTSMLFDFLCRIVNNFYLPLRDHILNGLMHAFKDSVDKRVIPSLQGFFATTTGSSTTAQTGGAILDRDLRALVQATFGNFFQTMSITPLSSGPFSAISPSGSPGLSQMQQQQQSPQSSQQQASPVLLPKPIFQTSPGSISPDITSPPVQSTSPTPSQGLTFHSAASVFKQQKSITPPVVDDITDIVDLPIKTESQGW